MRIWFDPTNSPHVLIVKGLLPLLESEGIEVTVTARDFAQTIPLLERYGIKYTRVGKHMGKSKIAKALGFLYRTLKLSALYRNEDLAFSIGSDYLVWAAKLRRIPVVYFQDNETLGSQRFIFPLCDKIVFPEAVPEEILLKKGAREQSLEFFPGLKEEMYLIDWEYDTESVRQELDLEKGDEVLGFRPEPYMAQYLGKSYEDYGIRFIQEVLDKTDYKVVVFPRTAYQKAVYKKEFGSRIIIPEKPVDGPSFLKIAKVFVSGGGTMVRESVALGTPAISMYPGRLLSVDRWLISEEYLLHSLTPSVSDLESAESLRKYKISEKPRKKVLEVIESFLM